MKFEKLLSNHLFISGIFIQYNWYNPIYLDKTGYVMSKTRDLLKDWNGNVGGFAFNSIENTFSGSVDMNKVWIKNNNNFFYNKEVLLSIVQEYFALCKNFSGYYEVCDFNRIGIRIQGIYDKIDDESMKRFNSVSEAFYENCKTEYGCKTLGLTTEFEKNDLFVHSIISNANKNNEKAKGPEKGYMFDFDIYKKFNKQSIETLEAENAGFLDFILTDYENLISASIKALKNYE